MEGEIYYICCINTTNISISLYSTIYTSIYVPKNLLSLAQCAPCVPHYALACTHARTGTPVRGVGGMVLYCIQPKQVPHNFSCNKGFIYKCLFINEIVPPTLPY